MTLDAAFAESAKNDFLLATSWLRSLLESTVPDRLNWSPAPTARTPIQVAAHAAMAIESMLGNLTGNPMSISTPREAEEWFRKQEAQFATVEAVHALLERNTSKYFSWLDDQLGADLDRMIRLPFGMGEIPLRMGIAFMPRHVDWHTAQIAYIQTAYGDLDTRL